MSYEALVFLAHGGPDGPDDVVPFLKNVLRGRPISDEQLNAIARKYEPFGGKSPVNDQIRDLMEKVDRDLRERGIELPTYFGNRNWKPYTGDTIGEMAANGVSSALAFVNSPFASYSGCRQYLEDIEGTRKDIGASAPEIDKLRLFFNHPSFIRATVERLEECPFLHSNDTLVIFSAHSLPGSMARSSDYEVQLGESCSLVAEQAGLAAWELAYQSRSGPPTVPWLEPSVEDAICTAENKGFRQVAVSPIGFMTDNMEVRHDLDTKAAKVAADTGIGYFRVPTVGSHSAIVSMIVDLVEERLKVRGDRAAIGRFPASPDRCAEGCCKPPIRR